MATAGFVADVRGVEQLTQLAKDLKAAGDKELRKELLKAGRQSAKPAKAKINEHALAELPHKGGLNTWVAGHIRVAAQTKLTGKNVGVRIRVKRPGKLKLSDLPRINDGHLRHPVYGSGKWVTQTIPGGFVERAMDEIGDLARDEFLAAVDNIAARLAAGG